MNDTTAILKDLRIPEKLIEKITGIVILVGMKILTWALYHEVQIGFSRMYSMRFLNSCFFPEGVIDNKRAARSLLSDKNLNIKQKFKLACIYCFTDDIENLFAEMTEEELEEFYNTECLGNITQSDLVKFWTYYLMNKVQKIEFILFRSTIENVVKSGSKAAVEYFLKLPNLYKNVLMYAASAAVKNGLQAKDDLIIFRNESDMSDLKSWVPRDYFVDILYFILLKMSKDEKIEFLKRDISLKAFEYKYRVRHFRESRVLNYLLNWPFQYEFMKNVELMWDFLPKVCYCRLLLQIFKKSTSKYYEDKTYDYKNLFQEFWSQSPESFKKFALSNREVKFIVNNRFVKFPLYILDTLLSSENFTLEDSNILVTILSSATEKQVENIICSKEWASVSLKLIRKGKMHVLDRLFSSYFPSNMHPNCLKRKFFFSQFSRIFFNLFKFHMDQHVDSIIQWSSLSKKDIQYLQWVMQASVRFKCHCLKLASDNIKIVDMILKWFNLSGESLAVYRIEIIECYHSESIMSFFAIEGKFESLDNILNWGFATEELRQEWKNVIVDAVEEEHFEKLISNPSPGNDHCSASNPKFFEGKWEEVEAFVTWGFSSENDKSRYKKRILQSVGKAIHFNLVKRNKWQEAEIFFSWLELTSEEIRKLKRCTLFEYGPAFSMFLDFMYAPNDERFFDYGGKNDAIELILRWYLTDEQLLHDFRIKFYELDHHRAFAAENTEIVLRDFDIFLEQRLKDIREEQREKS